MILLIIIIGTWCVGQSPLQRRPIHFFHFSTDFEVNTNSGVTRTDKGGTKHRRRITGERRKVPTMSQVLSSIQYIYSQKTSGSNMEAPNLFLAPGAI